MIIMRQIIPFKKELLFKTKVSEITSISLEHTLNIKQEDLISGEFHINGDYKMTEGSINREKFDFKIPFDIALDSRYDMNSIVIDIDNFYYEIINNESLQVNIDVYVEGEKLIEEDSNIIETETINTKENIIKEEATEEVLSKQEKNEIIQNDQEEKENREDREITLDILKEKPFLEQQIPISSEERISTTDQETENDRKKQNQLPMDTTIIDSTKITPLQDEFNLFENMDNSDTYVTYHVYIVKEEDTLEKIISKYETSKEAISLYNNIEDIKPGTKLIIPSSNE